MHVLLAGDGPAVDAVAAALADVDCDVERADADAVGDADLGVVVDEVGASAFAAANDAALSTGATWLAVELGGVGGHALADVDAAVSGFGPETGCFECLASRVAANRSPEAGTNGDAHDEGSLDASASRFAGALAGREAASLAAGQSSEAGESSGASESAVLGAVFELPHAEREFLPVPGCGCDDDERDRRVRTDYREADLDVALAAAERGLDERVGLVAEVGEAESYPAPYYLARTCDTSAFAAARAAPQSAGVDADWNAAFMKALGEGLERYCAGVYDAGDFETAPPAVVDGGVTPGDVVRDADAPAVDPEDPIRWVPGVDLDAREERFLAAELVQFPPPEERYATAITTGLGLGSSGADALAAGLTEVVERDATILAWYSTFEPLELRVDAEGYRTLAKRARSEGLEVTALLVTQDVDVPVVAVAVHREDGDWPQFAVGSDAALDPERAATDALAEALQNWMELRGMGRSTASAEDGAIGAFADFPQAASAFLDASGPVPAGSVGPDAVPSGEARVDALVDAVVDAGLTPYAARVTTRDVDEMGFEAVRVVVPGAQPLFTDDPAFGERARTVPASLGFEPRLDRRHHPYP
ncbi:bacteriocin biosynthesis protein SagD [Halorubellus sp. JP-L1]|uniref:YcaO-like family protein n=1 Tax=Halorubellus sp. JP-L1 TaxID=2715753 RepID=UPI0014079191|nr:YcaO-like family protein [Halorubellus sp. JP-L1]NHN40690.1 bacteriocin biosynthesis protein SagD [Halorubellus sp. JP-L1]